MPQVLNLKPDASGLYPHRYSPITLYSTDFSDLDASLVVECNPTDNFKRVQGSGMIRLAPQKFPPFGRLSLRSAAFFVPEKQLVEFSDSLHSGQDMYKGESFRLPVFAGVLNGIFDSSQFSSIVTTRLFSTASDFPSPDTYDFIRASDGGNDETKFTYYRLNTLGRRLFKMLKLLGYDFSSPVWVASYSQSVSKLINPNAMPLLAFLKVYTDIFLSGVQYNNSLIVYLLNCIHDHKDCVQQGTTWYLASSGTLTSSCIRELILSILVPFEQNMYLSAWNTPNSPDGVNNMTLPPGNNPLSPYLPGEFSYNINDHIASTPTNNISDNSGNNYLTGLSGFGLRLFEAFDKLVRRYGLAGTNSVKRLYASLGIKPNDYHSHFVSKIWEGTQQLKFHPVLSNADTKNGNAGQYVGDYAGFCASGFNIDFSHKTTEYGYIVVVSWLQITPIQLRGFKPSVLRKSGYDWWNPKFDGKAIRAIPASEISVLKNSDFMNPSRIGDADIFGFCNLYDDYRNMQDTVAGDLIDKLKSYIFARDYSAIRHTGIFKPQINNVQYYSYLQALGLTDPFLYDRSNGDRFWIEVDWDIQADRPVVSDSIAVDLNGPGDTEVPKNGHGMA